MCPPYDYNAIVLAEAFVLKARVFPCAQRLFLRSCCSIEAAMATKGAFAPVRATHTWIIHVLVAWEDDPANSLSLDESFCEIYKTVCLEKETHAH